MSKFSTDLTIQELIKKGELVCSHSDSARLDSEVLLAWVLGKDRAYLFTWPERVLTHEELEDFERALERRKSGEPVSYIIGEKEFWSLPFYVSPSTLIPRSDTEILVEQTLTLVKRYFFDVAIEFLDLGTGTGAIAAALASELPDASVDAVDCKAAAVVLAQKNIRRLSLSRVNVFKSDWYSEVKKRYHIIVSNPPYIDSNDEHLKQGDVRFEPLSALVSEKRGLADIQHIVSGAGKFLYPDGWLVLEHGYDQAKAVSLILEENNFVSVKTFQDLNQNDRVTIGKMNF